MATLTESIVPLQALLTNYRIQSQALSEYRILVIAFAGHSTTPYPLLEAMSTEEVAETFRVQQQEASYSSMLSMLASIEAFVRVDFLETRRKKGRFRSIFSEFGIRSRLSDILEIWSQLSPIHRAWVSKFRDLLNLRHWLAHGRYWNQNVGRYNYSPEYVYEVGIEVLRAITSD